MSSDAKQEIESLRAKLREANERAADAEILLLQSKRWLNNLSIFVAARESMRSAMHAKLTELMLGIDRQTGVRP